MKKLRVGVLFGGLSIEREVSFNSGRTICDHLDKELYDVVPLFQHTDNYLYILPVRFLYRGKIDDFSHRLSETQQLTWDDLPAHIDFMYVATHGQYAEDGRLQGMLELLGIPYLGSKLFASSFGMDKDIQKVFLQQAGVRVPESISFTPEQINTKEKNIVDGMQAQGLDFPVIVKPVAEGSSFGVSVVHSADQLDAALRKACFISGRQGQHVMVEQYIVGMEFTCIILTDPQTGKLFALPPTEVLKNHEYEIFDYQQKYMPGRVNERTPAHCSVEHIKKIQDTTLQAMHALQFTNMARIDGILSQDGDVYIIDSNPLSGMGPATFLFRQAAEHEMSHTTVINNLIKTELKDYDMEPRAMKNQDDTKRLKVAVLMGGDSREREVSFESGRNVCYKLSPAKYDVIPVFADDSMKLHLMTPRLLVHSSTREVMADIDQATPISWTALAESVDFVFLGLHGGSGENGVVQGALEMLQVPYNGPSVFTQALCQDKYKTAQFLQHKGFAVPRSVLVQKQDFLQDDTQKRIQNLFESSHQDCVVKPHNEGCSIGVSRVQTLDDLASACTALFETKDTVLIEECLSGTELTVGVIGNESPRALAPSESIAKNKVLSLEEKFLPGAGENQTPALLPPAAIELVQRTVEQVFVAIKGQGYSRIDCFYQTAQQSSTGQERVVILEINTLPALTPATCLYHQAAEQGLQPMDLLDEIIQLGLQAHTKVDIVHVDEALRLQEREV